MLSGLIALCTRAAAAPHAVDTTRDADPAYPIGDAPDDLEDSDDSDDGDELPEGAGERDPDRGAPTLDVLELDPLGALDLSREMSTTELEAMSPTIESDELDEDRGADVRLDGREIGSSAPPSRWGRIDVGVTWRRGVVARWESGSDGRSERATRIDDQIWLVATWRR